MTLFILLLIRNYRNIRTQLGNSSYNYAGYCIGCHTVGNDTLADNGGFDEISFIRPDSTTIDDVYGDSGGYLLDGLYDLLAAAFLLC